MSMSTKSLVEKHAGSDVALTDTEKDINNDSVHNRMIAKCHKDTPDLLEVMSSCNSKTVTETCNENDTDTEKDINSDTLHNPIHESSYQDIHHLYWR